MRRGCEASFRELVQRYLVLVYSTAFRITDDKHSAEDVAQHVFIDLAKKAKSLPADVHLGGWLHKHAMFLARNVRPSERRRKTRERQPLELHDITDYTDENIRAITSILDETISDLEVADRNLILLRFFERVEANTIHQTESFPRERCSGHSGCHRAHQVLASATGRSAFTGQLGKSPASMKAAEPASIEAALGPIIQSARALRDTSLDATEDD